MKNNKAIWIFWAAITIAGTSIIVAVIYIGGSRDLLLIGHTTSAHHQIELSCDTCHTSGFFASEKKINKDMNKACLACHKEELQVSNDSHPIKKFRNPRNADRRKKLDALFCTTCHAEHVPEITRPMAVTLPEDFCVACHENVGKDRPSHAGLGFETCASAGCHNFHDNKALYEDFLVKHAGKGDILDDPHHAFARVSRAPSALSVALKSDDPVSALAAYLETKDIRVPKGTEKAEAANKLAAVKIAKVLDDDKIDAPKKYQTEEAIEKWAGSAHALAGVNCATCHVADEKNRITAALIEENWVENPGLKVCADCHQEQADTFVQGKHGMRLHPKLSAPRKDGGVLSDNPVARLAARVFKDEPLPPMTVGQARIPMKQDAAHMEIGNCSTCHKPHDVNVKEAAVEACMTCHNDAHTQAYLDSPHHKLWQAELSGEAALGTGVTCATCHMPKIEGGESFFTTHNQNSYFRPNEKMIRPVCLSCHGIEFSIDALADKELVEKNFNGRPSKHIESVDWSLKRVKKDK